MKTSDRKLYPKASWATYFGDALPDPPGSRAKRASGAIACAFAWGFSRALLWATAAAGSPAAATATEGADSGFCFAAIRRASSREKAANLGSSDVVTTWV